MERLCINPFGVFWAICDGGVAFFAGFGRFWWFLPTTLAAFWAFDAGGVLIFSKLSEKQLEKQLKNFQKNNSKIPELNIAVQFSTFYATVSCFRISPLVLFCSKSSEFISCNRKRISFCYCILIRQLSCITRSAYFARADAALPLPHLHTTRNSMKSACCS